AIMQAVEEADAKRAQDMPTARDALSTLIRAEQRMKDLGWWKGGGLRVKPGDECAVAETGSTGMLSGRRGSGRSHVHCAGCASSPQTVGLKPNTALTDDERAWMQECNQREAEAYTAMMDRLAAQDDASHD